jgi:hypothetical protein
VVADTLHTTLQAHGYTPFNPFGVIPGKIYPEAVRLFVATAQNGWVRVLSQGAIPSQVLLSLAQTYTTLSIRIDTPDAATIQVYADGKLSVDRVAALTPFVRTGKNPRELQSALAKTEITIIEPEDVNPEFVPADTLPEDIQKMAKGIDPNAINNMFNKVAGGLFGKMNADTESVNALVEQSRQMNWNSPQGWKIRSLMDMLTIPAGWQEPNFIALRDAYSLHARKQRKPNARLYPGDAEAMAAVPNALDYIPVYAGKDEL